MDISVVRICRLPVSIIFEQNWRGVSVEFLGKASSALQINRAASKREISLFSRSVFAEIISLVMVL